MFLEIDQGMPGWMAFILIIAGVISVAVVYAFFQAVTALREIAGSLAKITGSGSQSRPNPNVQNEVGEDVEIGDLPAPPNRSPGWKDDPYNHANERRWTGSEWTYDVRSVPWWRFTSTQP